MNELEELVLQEEWFYRFVLPSGRMTSLRIPPERELIHSTRLQMMFTALEGLFASDFSEITCLDLACNEGSFAIKMAERGWRDVLGIDCRRDHISKANLIRSVYGYENIRFERRDLTSLLRGQLSPVDVVLMFGILYHLEDPIGAMRLARALTKRVLLLETQVAPGISGNIDWGSHHFQKEIMGTFCLIAESVDNPVAGSTGFCLCPSPEAVMNALKILGFRRVELLSPPKDGYEQLVSRKRIMVAAYPD